MKLIVGLGNPGEKYIGTRHNFGFEALDELRKKLNAPDWEINSKFNSELSKLGDDILLVRPQTFMNQSGLAVSSLKSFYKVEPEDIIVIHDELDLLLGHLKIRQGGGAGGHHGVESIIERLGTDSFVRVRLGIGTDKAFSGEHKRISFQAEKFVLDLFGEGERSGEKKTLKKAVLAIEIILKKGVDKAQNQFN